MFYKFKQDIYKTSPSDLFQLKCSFEDERYSNCVQKVLGNHVEISLLMQKIIFLKFCVRVFIPFPSAGCVQCTVQYIYALLSFSDYLQGDLTKYIYTVTPTLYNFEHQNKIPGKNFFKKIFYMSIRWKYSKRK